MTEDTSIHRDLYSFVDTAAKVELENNIQKVSREGREREKHDNRHRGDGQVLFWLNKAV